MDEYKLDNFKKCSTSATVIEDDKMKEWISIETIQQLRLSRMHTIGRVKRVGNSKFDFQPAGFSNNILWHAGHIFVIVETFLQQSIKSYEPKYPEWISLFDDGTSPSEWGEDVPTGAELLAALRAQMDWVIPFVEDKLNDKMDEPLVIGDNIMTISTIEGIIQFLSWHEGTHAGVINALSMLES